MIDSILPKLINRDGKLTAKSLTLQSQRMDYDRHESQSSHPLVKQS